MKFKTKCPRCLRESEIVSDNPKPRVSCGECLWQDVAIVPLICTLVEEGRDVR